MGRFDSQGTLVPTQKFKSPELSRMPVEFLPKVHAMRVKRPLPHLGLRSETGTVGQRHTSMCE